MEDFKKLISYTPHLAKARLIKEALLNQQSSAGNHNLYVQGDHVVYCYRSTPIAYIATADLYMTRVNAGSYENTVSTIRQRKDIEAAIKELKKVIQC